MKFKVGDRVAFYESSVRYVGTVFKVGEYSLAINTDNETWCVHPKQCRRLVKKKRFEAWVLADDEGYVVQANRSLEDAKVRLIGNPHLKIIHLREVREKKDA